MLSAGTRLGPYEIVAPLGAGGMGEVSRVGREAESRRRAEILPDAFADAPKQYHNVFRLNFVDEPARFTWDMKSTARVVVRAEIL